MPLPLLEERAVVPTKTDGAVRMAAAYPRVRFMGSKYRLLPELGRVFSELEDGPALDAFSGSGVVSYLLRASGRAVISNDQLVFARTFAEALVANDEATLSSDAVAEICGPNLDARGFISETFAGKYFSGTDHAFLDSAWSHITRLPRTHQAIALSGLCLAAARKQPRGVFTVVDRQYDDGRRHLRMSMEDLFREAIGQVNQAITLRRGLGGSSEAHAGDIFDLPKREVAIAYLDPPYAPRQDDTCYIKRYHFLEGLATYWEGQEILWHTKSRKLKKRHTPFAYKRSALDALDRVCGQFPGASIVLSYGSNAAFTADELAQVLARHRRDIERIDIEHQYAFGTHDRAQRRSATEYIFVARGCR